MSDFEDDVELRDGTVRFIPERLNRQPVVVRGLTNDEMFAVAGIGTGIGFVIGLLILIIFGSIPAMAATVVGIAFIFFLAGSAFLQRMKRGKPDTWFYRKMQWFLALKGISWGSGDRVIAYHGRWAAKHQRRIEGN